ncbi:hypothetical protein [Blastococcus saxobsidens]|uniref:Uncharacterized protein n=1 Tax=Blastococcus saxobsidens TaxID=138336 RepID=A0A4Q7Y5X3_9ACTN|nr:hypothetical protein [Blastococcus saxobsidens]RZU31309.1 hypothetical protein BKA19_0967 [Blastococcus saxobsidens]
MGTSAARTGQPASIRIAVRVGRVLGATLYVTTALFGALFTSWSSMLVVAPLLGALVGGAVALVRPDFAKDAASRRTVVHAAVAGVLALPFATGLPALGGLGSVVVLLLLVVGSLTVDDWLAAGEPGPRVGHPAELRPVLGVLPTAELVSAWLRTEDLLRSARDRSRVAELRELLLDELARRDPEGVARWLAAGGRSPVPHVRTDRDLTGP